MALDPWCLNCDSPLSDHAGLKCVSEPTTFYPPPHLLTTVAGLMAYLEEMRARMAAHQPGTAAWNKAFANVHRVERELEVTRRARGRPAP